MLLAAGIDTLYSGAWQEILTLYLRDCLAASPWCHGPRSNPVFLSFDITFSRKSLEIRIYLSTSALKEITSMSEVFILMLGSKRILEWEMSIPRMFMDEKSKEIGDLYGLLWQTGERLSDLLKKKRDYDILHTGN